MRLIDTLKGGYMNFFGWSTRRKIVVFESDDWGSIRMHSPEAFERFKRIGYEVERCPYNRYDRLENNDDLMALMDVLCSVNDNKGNVAKLTLNNVVGNPDFEKIKKSKFEKYYYEPFVDTYKRYPNHDRVMQLYKEGVVRGCFSMQFHGREHVNIDNWLNHLKSDDQTALKAFDEQMFSVHRSGSLKHPRKEFLDTYGLGFKNRQTDHKQEIGEGLKLFESIWGKTSLTMVAPTCVWDDEVEEIAKRHGVIGMQGVFVQLVPTAQEKSGYKVKRLYQGRKTDKGLINLMRNVFFEPVNSSVINWKNKCIQEINLAFLMKKPAIIATHRVNFMGGMDESNRKRNLKILKSLLDTIVKMHPDVEFMGSDQLVRLMRN